MTRSRLVRVLFVLGFVALCWTVFTMWTGGGVLYLGGVRVSSRGQRNSTLLGLVMLALAFITAPKGHRLRVLAAEYQRIAGWASSRLDQVPAWLRRPRTVAVAAALSVVTVGFTEGALVVGGSDSYGYVSQAHLWTLGTLRQEPVLARELSSFVAPYVLAPLGYWPSPDGTTIAPTYSAGLPLVMAVFEKVAGPASVFWVVPLLGGVLVWATYLLGARVSAPAAGALAAVLAATSPPLLFQLTAAPMSDLPAAAWWTLALALVAMDRRVSALGAGAAAGLAVLTRPNLAPLLLVAGGLLVWRLAVRQRQYLLACQHAVLFALLAIPACLAVAAINQHLWGSPLVSGYGSLAALFGVANIWPNLLLYPRVVATLMPAVLLMPVAAIVRWRRPHWFRRAECDRTLTVALWAFVATAGLSYVAYPPFDSEWNLRFLLPAVPPLLVLSSIAALSLAGRLLETRRAACLAAVLILTGYSVDHARDVGAFSTGHLRRFSAIGDSIARELPERAVLLAMLHSGSANFYSGRPTLRYDLLPPTGLDPLVRELRRLGYVPYVAIDDDERRHFQEYFRGHSSFANLDWPPVVSLPSLGAGIWALPDRPPATAGPPASSTAVPGADP